MHDEAIENRDNPQSGQIDSRSGVSAMALSTVYGCPLYIFISCPIPFNPG
jgi:hypothetical protein